MPKVFTDFEFDDRVCSDLGDCEHHMFQLVLQLLYESLQSQSPEQLKRAKELMVRAQLFPQLNWNDRAQIEDYSSSIYYTEGILMLELIHGDYRSVLKKLYRAKAGPGFVDEAAVDARIAFVEEQIRQLEAIGIGCAPRCEDKNGEDKPHALPKKSKESVPAPGLGPL